MSECSKVFSLLLLLFFNLLLPHILGISSCFGFYNSCAVIFNFTYHRITRQKKIKHHKMKCKDHIIQAQKLFSFNFLLMNADSLFVVAFLIDGNRKYAIHIAYCIFPISNNTPNTQTPLDPWNRRRKKERKNKRGDKSFICYCIRFLFHFFLHLYTRTVFKATQIIISYHKFCITLNTLSYLDPITDLWKFYKWKNRMTIEFLDMHAIDIFIQRFFGYSLWYFVNS